MGIGYVVLAYFKENTEPKYFGFGFDTLDEAEGYGLMLKEENSEIHSTEIKFHCYCVDCGRELIQDIKDIHFDKMGRHTNCPYGCGSFNV